MIEIDDKKSFVSNSQRTDGLDRAERQEVKETEIARHKANIYLSVLRYMSSSVIPQ